MFALVPLFLVADPLPIALDTMAVERARSLHGQTVTITLLVAKPAYAERGKTIVGAHDHPDAIERTAHLRGMRYEVDGQRITVTGRLWVIDHPGVIVGMAFVPPWTEIRVEEGK